MNRIIIPEQIKSLKTISTSSHCTLEAPDNETLVWDNLRSIYNKKLSYMMIAASFDKFLESKRYSKDEFVKMVFEFYHLAHFFIEGEASTKVGE